VGGGHRVESSGLQINFIQPTNNKVPRGSPRLGHVAPYNQPKSSTCRNIVRPYLSTNECHVSYSPANLALPRVIQTCHVNIRTDWTVQSASLFLLVCHFEQNTISLSPDVHLNPNKLRWVRNDKAYALVRFEVITSTLNFEQNLIAWIIKFVGFFESVIFLKELMLHLLKR
jgi:hypothetical protein